MSYPRCRLTKNLTRTPGRRRRDFPRRRLHSEGAVTQIDERLGVMQSPALPEDSGAPRQPLHRRLALLGGGAVLAYTFIQPRVPSPDATLRAYCQAVTGADAGGMYRLLSQQAQAQNSLESIECAFALRDSGALAVATTLLTLSVSLQGQPFSVTTSMLVSLVLESNQWRIDFSDFTQPLPGLDLPGWPVSGTTSARSAAWDCAHMCR